MDISSRALDSGYWALGFGLWILGHGPGSGSWFLDLVSWGLIQMGGSWIIADWILELGTWAFGRGSRNLDLGSRELSVSLEPW